MDLDIHLEVTILSEKFRTDYKNEIPIGEVRLYDMIDENGGYIGKGVKLVRSNGNLQEGDTFSALEVNAIHEFLNGLISGSKVVGIANALRTLGNNNMCAFWSDGSLKFNIDSAENVRVFNTYLHNGYKIRAHRFSVNPAGAQDIYVQLPSDFKSYGASISTNGNVDANGCYPIACKQADANRLKFTLNKPTTNSIQIDYVLLYF